MNFTTKAWWLFCHHSVSSTKVCSHNLWCWEHWMTFVISLGMMMQCMNNNSELLESISLKESAPMLRMSLGETEMTLIFIKTTIHFLQWINNCTVQIPPRLWRKFSSFNSSSTISLTCVGTRPEGGVARSKFVPRSWYTTYEPSWLQTSSEQTQHS